LAHKIKTLGTLKKRFSHTSLVLIVGTTEYRKGRGGVVTQLKKGEGTTVIMDLFPICLPWEVVGNTRKKGM
jgi:hypothetical protein